MTGENIEPNAGPRVSAQTNIELGNDLEPQLYDLATDVRERTNVAAKNPKPAAGRVYREAP